MEILLNLLKFACLVPLHVPTIYSIVIRRASHISQSVLERLLPSHYPDPKLLPHDIIPTPNSYAHIRHVIFGTTASFLDCR